VQRLARVRARSEDRVIAEQLRVAVGGALSFRRPQTSPTKLSTSITSLPSPGPAPAFQARSSARPSSLSSWRTCPNVNARTNVPSVEGAATQPPSSRRVRPDRRTSQSSMLSAPSAIAKISDITLRPALPAPGSFGRSRTNRCADSSIPSRRRERRQEHQPRVRDDALVVEFDLHPVQSDRPVILHHERDLLTPGPGCPDSLKKPC